jgi:transcription elongation factor Elf1
MNGITTMTGVDAHVISFQCPQCGHDLQQTIGDLKSREHMRCPGCGIGINIDTNRISNAAEEMQRAIDKVPSEITIKFFRQ